MRGGSLPTGIRYTIGHLFVFYSDCLPLYFHNSPLGIDWPRQNPDDWTPAIVQKWVASFGDDFKTELVKHSPLSDSRAVKKTQKRNCSLGKTAKKFHDKGVTGAIMLKILSCLQFPGLTDNLDSIQALSCCIVAFSWQNIHHSNRKRHT